MGKKRKNVDFQKTTLKVGRQLPKGLNVTDTSFKSKKIVLRDHNTEELDETHPFNKLGVVDLLKRLQHYSPVMRQSSLSRLKDLLSTEPSLVSNYLVDIVDGVCQLMLDREQPVRKTLVATLGAVFASTSHAQLEPFFPILNSYLCCAMTHIVPDIQFDSLIFLDLFLEKIPKLLVVSASQILNHFLDQISVSKEVNGVSSRTLLVTPGQKLTSQKWRLQVLARMEKLLGAIIKEWNASERKWKNKTIVWDPNGPPLFHSIYSTRSGEPEVANRFTLASSDQLKEVFSTAIKDPKTVKNFVSVFVPLLIETWLETSHAQYATSGDISFEAAETMKTILNVACLIGEWVEHLDNESNSNTYLLWFQREFAKDFVTHFMIPFPYSHISKKTQRKKNIEEDVTLSSTSLNLLVCEVLNLLVPDISALSDTLCSKMVDFLCLSLKNRSIQGSNNIQKVIRIVDRMISFGGQKKESSNSKIQQILDSFWWICQNSEPTRKERQTVFFFFFELLSPKKKISLKFLTESKSFVSWFEHLPKEIISLSTHPELVLVVLEKTSKIACRGYPSFCKGLQSHNEEIIGLLETINGGSPEKTQLAQRYLVEIILAIPKLDISSFRILTRVLRSNNVHVQNAIYLVEVLSIRCAQKSSPGFISGHLLSLLLCLQFGISHSEVKFNSNLFLNDPKLSRYHEGFPQVCRCIVFPSEPEIWERHKTLSKAVLGFILQFSDLEAVEESSYKYLNKILETSYHLPSHCISGILDLASAFHMATDIEESSLNEDLMWSLIELAIMGLFMIGSERCRVNPGTMVPSEAFLEKVLTFIKNTEFAHPLSNLFEQQICEKKRLSQSEVDCVGYVIWDLLKSGVLPRSDLRTLERILHKIQTFPGVVVNDKQWWGKSLYEMKNQQKIS